MFEFYYQSQQSTESLNKYFDLEDVADSKTRQVLADSMVVSQHCNR